MTVICSSRSWAKVLTRNDIRVIALKKGEIYWLYCQDQCQAIEGEEDGKEVRNNIQLRFIDSCRFVASNLD